jgi:hypothetical protein
VRQRVLEQPCGSVCWSNRASACVGATVRQRVACTLQRPSSAVRVRAALCCALACALKRPSSTTGRPKRKVACANSSNCAPLESRWRAVREPLESR